MESFDINEEFNQRVKHNFRLYVLLTSKSVHWSESRILEGIWKLDGYKCHKTVKYGKNSSHIHVKFEGERSARKAVKILNRLNSDLTAILVEDMLKGWLDYEVRVGGGPKWTLTIVDIMGDPPLSLNFLTSNIMNYIFADFGAPYLLPYTAALNEPHVQVLFSSMTEALAACMAFGEWHKIGSNMDSFSYRVRINPSDREAYLIRNSGGTPREAFKLDYFVSLRDDIYRNSRSSGCDSKQSRVSKNKTAPHGKGTLKLRQQKHSHSNTELSHVLLNQLSNNTPILCVPLIAPLGKFTKAMADTNSQLNSDLSTAVMNFQQTLSDSSGAKVPGNPEMENSDSDIANKDSGNTEIENSYPFIASKDFCNTGMENSCSAVASKGSGSDTTEMNSYSAVASKGSDATEMNCYSAVASKNYGQSIVEDLKQSCQISEKVALKDITPRSDEDIILNYPPAQQIRKASMKNKSTYKGSRVFERRT